MDWPDWWSWDLEVTPHLLKRMIDRQFNEADLRSMLEVATRFRPSSEEGRFIIETIHDHRSWEVVVEPDPAICVLIVVTAYPRG